MKIVKFSFKVYYLPKTNVCPKFFNKRKDKRENWMTDELLNQINRKNCMLTGNTNQNQLISTIQEKLILKRMKELLAKIYKKPKEYIILINLKILNI